MAVNKNFLVSCFLIILTGGTHVSGKGIRETIPAPEGCGRVFVEDSSYSLWITGLPLKMKKRIYDFKKKKLLTEHFKVFAVVDKSPLHPVDLEHGPAYAMRFWTEYHEDMKKLDQLYLPDYHGARRIFKQSGMDLDKFLKYMMAVSNSHSLKLGCEKVEPDSLMPGDMIVQRKSGEVGHTSVIVDVCADKEGGKLYLIGFGFMPAQEFHIEKAANQYGREGWFTLDGYYDFLKTAPYKRLGKPVLRRFREPGK